MSPSSAAAAPLTSDSLLTPAEQAAYVRDGFIWSDDVFSATEIAELSAIVEAQDFASAYKQRTHTVHSLSLTAADPRLKALACDPRIVGRLLPLLGPDICLQHSKLAAKPLTPGTGLFSWHQDFAYYPHTNTDLLSVMVMLDDATPDNGCMSMVPGSHRLGLLPHHDADGYFIGGCTREELWRNADDTVAVTPRAGGISIHHALTLHGSPVNRSGRPRRGLVFSYRAADAQQLADTVFTDTGLVVAGRRSGRMRCEQMDIVLPRWRSEQQPHRDAWHQVGAAATEWNVAAGLTPSGMASIPLA